MALSLQSQTVFKVAEEHIHRLFTWVWGWGWGGGVVKLKISKWPMKQTLPSRQAWQQSNTHIQLSTQTANVHTWDRKQTTSHTQCSHCISFVCRRIVNAEAGLLNDTLWNHDITFEKKKIKKKSSCPQTHHISNPSRRQEHTLQKTLLHGDMQQRDFFTNFYSCRHLAGHLKMTFIIYRQMEAMQVREAHILHWSFGSQILWRFLLQSHLFRWDVGVCSDRDLPSTNRHCVNPHNEDQYLDNSPHANSYSWYKPVNSQAYSLRTALGVSIYESINVSLALFLFCFFLPLARKQNWFENISCLPKVEQSEKPARLVFFSLVVHWLNVIFFSTATDLPETRYCTSTSSHRILACTAFWAPPFYFLAVAK